MRIGLITYHHSNNYGAILQSYATYRALNELGHDVEFINIQQQERKKLRHLAFIFKTLSFKKFRKKFYPKETQYIKNMEELKEAKFNYDCLIVGSDQVWNPNISLDKCLAYFLDFGDINVHRISYASSFGISKWPDNKKNIIPLISKLLKKFDSISVREKTGQDLLLTQFGVHSQIVLDPTMLHKDYNEIANNIEKKNDIICYLLNRTEEQLKASRYISLITKHPLKLISNIYPIPGFKYVYPPSIQKWIKYIGGAHLVITDSFHGLVFSLLYRRNFIILAVENGKNSRLLDLLDLLGLQDRYFTSLEQLKENYKNIKEIDYTKIGTIIEKKRNESWAFLKKSLSFD